MGLSGAIQGTVLTQRHPKPPLHGEMLGFSGAAAEVVYPNLLRRSARQALLENVVRRTAVNP